MCVIKKYYQQYHVQFFYKKAKRKKKEIRNNSPFTHTLIKYSISLFLKQYVRTHAYSTRNEKFVLDNFNGRKGSFI